MTEIGDALNKAIEVKKNDINNFTWKYQNGNEVRLMDLSNDELQKCYDHTTDMLWNKSNYNPGKYVIRENIQNTFNNCNTQLFVRWLLNEHDIATLKTNKDLLDFINTHKQSNDVKNSDNISNLFANLPVVYEKITVDKLMNACFDKLDVLNRKMISNKFILSQGIWLTEDEKKELTEFDESGNMKNRMDVIKERLVLNPEIKLRIDPNGLSYNEFRSLINLEPLPKISSLTTATLKLLRDKILLLLDNDLDYHINKWTTLKENVEKVAEYKNINLICKEY